MLSAVGAEEAYHNITFQFFDVIQSLLARVNSMGSKLSEIFVEFMPVLLEDL